MPSSVSDACNFRSSELAARQFFLVAASLPRRLSPGPCSGRSLDRFFFFFPLSCAKCDSGASPGCAQTRRRTFLSPRKLLDWIEKLHRRSESAASAVRPSNWNCTVRIHREAPNISPAPQSRHGYYSNRKNSSTKFADSDETNARASIETISPPATSQQIPA